MTDSHKSQGGDRHDDDHGGQNSKKEKETTIIVNGRERTVTGKDVTFDQLVALAFDTPPTGENIVFTITYRRGHGNKPEGSVLEGGSVKVKKGMIFNVTPTDKS